MSDEFNPPEEPSPATGNVTFAPGSGLPTNTAAGLASLFSLPGGLVFYFLDRKDPFVRHYAVQAIILGSILAIVSLTFDLGIYMFNPMPLIGWIFVWVLKAILLVLQLAWLVAWMIVTFCAFRGIKWQLPFLATMLKRYTSRLHR